MLYVLYEETRSHRFRLLYFVVILNINKDTISNIYDHSKHELN